MTLTQEEEEKLKKTFEVEKAKVAFANANKTYMDVFNAEVTKLRAIVDADHRPNIIALRQTYEDLLAELKALHEA